MGDPTDLPDAEAKMIEALSRWISRRTIERSEIKVRHRTELDAYDRATKKGQTFVKRNSRLPTDDELGQL